ncbi:uncharacterized protein ARB_02977 [Trichophyton benhamiae CBS 112371]|uniref:Uncharacterized protein n=1 Tax=Arthroderma benhamiae (strain ATCC MYA-4681 / CBS 112371) TaxID=663331 RepID=D4B3E0_ARTBC|nr:uncharacterized protein ARB_02977 [Trichophyton benhamiae CBS 112371]EFE30186.1 hypothetical protein ARB_02977 [Trichophyton benhamiae CBS 112371]
MFDLHIDESNIKIDMLSFYNDSVPFLESSAALVTEKPIMQDVTSQNIPVSPHTKETSEMPRGQCSPTEMAPDNYVRELMVFGLAQYDQLRCLQRMRNCTGNDKRGVFSRLRNYPIHGMLEHVRRLTELIRQLMPISDSSDSSLHILCSELVSETIPDIDSCLLNEEALMNDFSNMLAHPFSESCLSSGDSISQLSPLTPSKQTPVDTSTILLFVSCYLRLARAFALFFTDLHAFLLFPSAIDPTPTGELRIFPGLKLGSFQSYVGVSLEISIAIQVSERMLCRLHDSLGLSWNQCSSESLPNSQLSADAWSNADTITRAMIKTIQAQEEIDAQDERGDTFTRLLLTMENVKKLVKTQPFL